MARNLGLLFERSRFARPYLSALRGGAALRAAKRAQVARRKAPPRPLPSPRHLKGVA